ncbi:MAG: hypothetical protein R3B47_00760 [Bacteroidia bacterium]
MKQYIIILITLGFGTGLFAQNDPLGGQDKIVLENERIEDVINSEKPPMKVPYQEIGEDDIPKLNYQSQDIKVETDFEPDPPSPAAYQPDPLPEVKNNYAKAGFGRYTTPLLDVYLYSGRDQDYDYGLEFSHLSAHSDKVERREFNNNRLGITGSYGLNEQTKVSGQLEVLNRSYWNYGDTVMRANLFDTTKMGFTQVSLGANLFRPYEEGNQLDYNLGANIEFHQDKRTNRELHISLIPEVSFAINDELDLGFESKFTVTGAKIAGFGQSRLYGALKPYIRYSSGAVQVVAGLRGSMYNNNADLQGQSLFVPEGELRARILPQELTVFLGHTGGIKYNRYSDLIRTNPYLSSIVEIQPTLEKTNLYAGVSGQIPNLLDYNARVSYRRVGNALIHMVPVDGAYFMLGYDSLMTDLGLHLEVNHDLLKTVKIGAALDVHNYTTSTVADNFHAPPLQLTGYGEYSQNKLTARTEVNFFGSTPMTVNNENIVENRPVYVDLNLGADYKLTEQFSVWAEVNNLLNSNYQRWWNYTERPFDVKAGITLGF